MLVEINFAKKMYMCNKSVTLLALKHKWSSNCDGHLQA